MACTVGSAPTHNQITLAIVPLDGDDVMSHLQPGGQAQNEKARQAGTWPGLLFDEIRGGRRPHRQWNRTFTPALTTFAVSFELLGSPMIVWVTRSVAFGVSVWFCVPKFR